MVVVFPEEEAFQRRGDGSVRIIDYEVPYFLVVAVLALLIASPALSRMLVYPRTEFFTELWILDASRRAENYPFNISRGSEYRIHLGIGNRLGYCAYCLVEVKFRNETQSKPEAFGPIENRSPSTVESLFNITAFVADEAVWELPLTFTFDYDVSAEHTQVTLRHLILNDAILDLSGYTTTWNSTKRVFLGNLVFELWTYDSAPDLLSYSGRFVDLKLNMTQQ